MKCGKSIPSQEESTKRAARSRTQRVDICTGRPNTKVLPLSELAKGGESESDTQCPTPSILRVAGNRTYDIEGVLAKGGMGVIYQATDPACGRSVAVKVLAKDLPYLPDNLRCYMEEARITSRLEHPNIMPVHEVGGDAEGSPFYIMKLVQGVTLAEALMAIRKGDRKTINEYSLGRLLTVFQKVCDAVAFAHSKGVVHSDLAPNNVMIGDYGEVLVMDWGLARVVGDPAVDPVRVVSSASRTGTKEDGLEVVEAAEEVDAPVRSGRKNTRFARNGGNEPELKTTDRCVMGTLGFLAPERVRTGEEVVDTRSDIYSLGGILYSILTLRSSVEGDHIEECVRRIVTGSICPPATYNRPSKTSETEDTAADGNPLRFPHCPGGQIPVRLSEIVMKAMARDPEGRYASVLELQREVEAYQDGLIWHLVIDEDFSSPEVSLRWEVVEGRYEITDGELRLSGGEPQLLLLKREVHGDVRIEFECYQESMYSNYVGCFLSAMRSVNGRDVPLGGYEFKHGGYDNSLNVIMRSGQRMCSRLVSPLTRSKKLQVRAERIGPRLKMMVNGQEVLDVADMDPLSGADRTAVGLLGWTEDMRYTSVRIYNLSAPSRSDVLDMAERQLQKGHYVTAMELSQDVMDSFPDAERMEKARTISAVAENRGTIVKNLPSWRGSLERHWPSAQVRMDNDGLTVDISNAGIDDLGPLKGLPVSTLNCAGNNIRSLDPLAGMPLVKLNCGANPITSLEPLCGMSLHTLLCECCRITSLEPLRGMPLGMLNCGENGLKEGLEPLHGMALTWLSCWGNGITGLDPLRGMLLNTLSCEANQITSLDPLRGMPLNTLSCEANQVTSLGPLHDMPMIALYCGRNQITNLEALAGMPLTVLRCHSNRIRSLEPLVGMPLGSLECDGNELTGIESFIKHPPRDFFFDGDSISTRELEWIHKTWSQSAGLAAHARSAEILLALKTSDAEKLKALAIEFCKHRYLLIPKCAGWNDAKVFCEYLGGHLVTINSRQENDFLSSLCPHGIRFWIGLQTTAGRHEWVTDQPFTFSAFVDVVREKRAGPKVFRNGTWSSDVLPDAHNCFMVEWE